MKTSLSRCFACFLLMSALFLLSCEVVTVRAKAPVRPSKLSPANDVFDLEQEGLRLLWRAELGRITESRLKNLYCAGDMIVAETPTGETHILDSSNGQWKTVKTFTHGLRAAPTATGKKLLLVSGNRVYLFEPETGDLSKGYHPRFALSTRPLVFQDSLILAGGNGHLARVTIADWGERWLISIRGPIWEEPILSGDKLFAASSELICLRPKDGTELWRWEPEEPSRISTGLLVHGDVIYVGDNRGYLYALGTDYGDQRWKKPFGAPVVGRPELVDGKLFVFTSEPALTCLEASGKREELWTYEGAVRLLTSGQDTVYVLTEDNSVAGLSPETGEELWRDPLPEDCQVTGDPNRPVLYVGNAQGSIAALQQLD